MSMAESYRKAVEAGKGLDRYVRSIRNPAKQEYARLYLAWRGGDGPYDFDGGPEDPAGPAGRLSYMARQAVRMRIEEFFHSWLETE